TETLGASIKNIRKEKNLTLKDLAEKTGFSISFLSQLEREKSSATLESLKKISLALDVNPGYFFDDDFNEEQPVRRESREKEHMEKLGIFYESLSDTVENPAFSPQYIVLNPGQNKGNLIKHEGQEFLFVVKGQLTVRIEENTYILDELDSLMFDSGREHYWYNYTDDDVEFLCVNYDIH